MMKKITLFCLGWLACSWCLLSFGQNVPDQLKSIRSTVVDTIDGRPFYIHTIKRGQTLYMISKAYGLDVNDLIRENPGVKEGIKADEILRVPMKGFEKKKSVIPESKPVSKPPEDTVKVHVQLPCGEDVSTKKSLYQVALMIPLYLGDAESLKTENPDRKSTEDARCLQFLPFYEGFRIALDSLEHTGLKIKLFVYDVDKDTVKTRQLLKKPELKSMDLIIGLLYHQNFRIVADFALRNKIRIINPISERSEIIKNQYVIKLQPDKEKIPEALAAYLYKADPGARFLIVKNNQKSPESFSENLSAKMEEWKMKVVIADGQQDIFNHLSRDENNYIIAWGSSPEYIVDFTRRLYELRNDYRIVLVGLPDWHLVNGVEPDYLVTMKTHAVVSGFVKYEDPFVSWFVNTYQNQYKTDPEMIAFEGFDVAWYFLSAMYKYGTGFARCLEEFKCENLATKYKFNSPTPATGYENNQWVMTRFENYRLVPEYVY